MSPLNDFQIKFVMFLLAGGFTVTGFGVAFVWSAFAHKYLQ